jgi:hypothetical protein
MLEAIRKQSRASGLSDVPVVLENHTKDLQNFSDLERFLEKAVESSDVRFITLTELARNLKEKFKIKTRSLIEHAATNNLNALRQRYIEVCKIASQPAPNAFGELTDFVSRLRTQLDTAVEGQQFKKWTALKTWFASKCDSLTAIRALAVDEPVECMETAPPDEPGFFADLQASIREPQRRFELLTTRYIHPLNVAASSEQRVREHLLERLMVADRSRIEQHSLHLLNADDLLLRLNLIAIYGSFTADLRYLDALNYYYELLPSAWYPESSHNWLRVSFLSFYVRALAVHFTHFN